MMPLAAMALFLSSSAALTQPAEPQQTTLPVLPASVSAMRLVQPLSAPKQEKMEPLRYTLCDLFPDSPVLVFGPFGVRIERKTPPPAE